MKKFILQHKLAPGDVLVMSGLVRDLALAYPGQFQVSVDTTAGELWRHNPHATFYEPSAIQEDAEVIKLSYSHAIENVRNRNRHFLLGFHEDFERKTGIHVPLLYPYPDYHLSPEEKHVPLVSGRYWIVVSGGKSDFMTKHWLYKRYQQVVNVLRQGGIHCVQLGAVGYGEKLYHYHPRLENTLCLVGLTTLRDMARLIYHAEGVICPVTVAMHMAAAMHKPCVVLAGGREEWWWEAYVPNLDNFGSELLEDVKVPHKYLHTIGLLDCCKRTGCWRNTLEPGESCCKQLLAIGGQVVPRCMDMLTVNHVIEAVMSYYEDGILPPVEQPKHIALINGRLRVLHPSEITPEQPDSALVAALTFPEPKLLTETTGQQLLKQQTQ